jgi:hypothetical protein
LVSRNELRQGVFSWELHYLLVSTIRNRPQIANEKSTIFKTEFFNRIGHKPSVYNRLIEGPLNRALRSVRRVSAETSGLNVGSCGELPLAPRPGKSLLAAKSRPRLAFPTPGNAILNCDRPSAGFVRANSNPARNNRDSIPPWSNCDKGEVATLINSKEFIIFIHEFHSHIIRSYLTKVADIVLAEGWGAVWFCIGLMDRL